jgi:hypothetical protein
LAFETDLLYLDVVNGKVGIKTTPNPLLDYDLDVNGTTRTTYLEVDTEADIASFTISSNTIASSNGTISLEPSGANPVVYQAKLVLDDLQISTNTIEVTTADQDLQFKTVGTGKVVIGTVAHNTDVLINGNLHATGNITADGDITIGDANTDNIVFNADINSHIIPETDITWDLGSDPTVVGGKEWRNLYANAVVATTLEIEDLTVNGDLTVTGAGTFNGDVQFGDTTADTITFNGTVSSDIIPTTTAFYDLGTDSLRWNGGYFSRVEIDSLVIDSNTISTTSGNDNLILQAAGTGIISIPTNNVQLDQQLTVNGDTSLQATTINGNITQTGNVDQTGDYTQTGDTTITGNLTVSTFGQFEKIRIDSNEISTTATDTDLQLEADGTGIILIPNNDVQIDQNLTVNGTATINDLSVTTTITADSLSDGNILIENNTIATTLTDSDLELSANGTGIISIPTNNVQLDQQLTVNGDTTLKATTINGNITQTGDVDQTGDYTQTGDTTITGNLTVSTFGQFEKIRIDGNTVSTTATDTDLQLEANGAGKIYVSTDDVLIEQNLTVNTLATFNALEVTTQVTAASFNDGDILIENNTITTQLTNSDLELSANGTGIISIPTNDVQLDQQLTVNGDTTLKATTINGNITQTGNVDQTGDYTQTGDTTITGNLTVSTFGQFEKIRIDSNEISTTATDTDLQLEANGAGKIYVPTDDVLINQNLTVDGLATIADVDVTNTLSAGSFTTGDLLIDDNFITTTLTNSNLELKADGTGIISIPNNDVEITQDLTVGGAFTVTTGTSYLKDVTVTGDITQTGDINQTGDFTTSGNTEVTGNVTATGILELSDITISGNRIETTTTNTDLDLRANGAGDIIFEQLRVTNNNIQATVTNADITLTPGTTGSVVINSNQSLVIPAGGDATRPASPVNGMIRYNTDRNRYEGYYAVTNKWLQLSGVTDEDGNTYITAESTPGANDNILRFYVDSVLMAYIDANKLSTTRLETDQLAIYDNEITTVATDTDINLTTSGTGSVKIGNLKLRNNTITNTVSGAVTEFAGTGTGYVKITGTNGVVIPSGDIGARPSAPVVGMVRFNTFYAIMEVWDGTTWVNVAGATSGISITQATEIGIVSALLFG